MIINRNSSVVEFGTFRRILCALKLGANRAADTVLVFGTSNAVKEGREYITPYATEEVQGKPLRSLDVDEGFFSSVLYDGPGSLNGLAGYSAGWMELVDFRQVLGLMVMVLDPAFVVPPCNFSGQGRRQEYYIHEYWERLAQLKEENPGLDYPLYGFEFQ